MQAGKTLLLLATYDGIEHLPAVQLLIERGANVNASEVIVAHTLAP